MKLETFFEKFELFADAPDAVVKMRELVLELAVQGTLVEQRPKELSARECIRMANKPLVEVAPDESIETPSGWVALPLGCLIAANTGGGTPSKQNPSFWNGPIPWASVKDVQSAKHLTSTIDSITEDGLKNSSSNLIPPNRLIVVTRMGLGKLAINTIPLAINQDLRAIEPTTALDLDFAYLLFKSLKMVGTGVTVKGIAVDKLHSMTVSLPPFAEQKRIVAKVDELMALCDRLEAQQQEREKQHAALARASLARFAEAPTPANLQFLFHPSYAISPADLRKSILTLAVQGKLVPQDPNDEPAEELLETIAKQRAKLLGSDSLRKTKPCRQFTADETPNEIPATWAWTMLGEVTDIGTGSTPSRSEASFWIGGTVPWITSGSTSRSPITEGDELVTSAAVKAHRLRIYPPGTLLVALYGQGKTRGQVALLEISATVNQACAAVCPLNGVPPMQGYLKLLLEKQYDEMRSLSAGGAQPNLNVQKIKEVFVPLPPLAEQRRIVAKVDQLIALVDCLESQLAASRESAGKLLEALLTELTKPNVHMVPARDRIPVADYFVQLIPAFLQERGGKVDLEDLNAAVSLLFLPKIRKAMLDASGDASAVRHFSNFDQPLDETIFLSIIQGLVRSRVIDFKGGKRCILQLEPGEAPPITPIVKEDARHLAALLPQSVNPSQVIIPTDELRKQLAAT